jgi:hypothetical protein
MSMIHRTRTAISILVAAFAITLVAPIAVNAEDDGIAAEEQFLAAAPALPSWDETSGYGSVEASRAEASTLLAPGSVPSWDETSGYASVEATRAEVGALVSGEMMSADEHALAIAAAAAAWDDTSGYGSVEASRAGN